MAPSSPGPTVHLMGHVMFVALEDLMIRRSRMQGRAALWVPGTDHAGIATQLQVEKLLEREGTSPEAIGREAPSVHVIAMAMPLLSLEAALRIEERLGIALPASLKDVLAGGDLEAAWGTFAATIRELVQSPLVDGAAIMTFEMDAPPEMGERILSALGDAGVA